MRPPLKDAAREDLQPPRKPRQRPVYVIPPNSVYRTPIVQFEREVRAVFPGAYVTEVRGRPSEAEVGLPPRQIEPGQLDGEA